MSAARDEKVCLKLTKEGVSHVALESTPSNDFDALSPCQLTLFCYNLEFLVLLQVGCERSLLWFGMTVQEMVVHLCDTLVHAVLRQAGGMALPYLLITTSLLQEQRHNRTALFACNHGDVHAQSIMCQQCSWTRRCTSAYLDASDPAISQSVMARAPDGMEGVWPQKAVRQFRRLTFQCSEAGAAAEALQGRGPIPLTYDIVAVQPATERVFQQVTVKSDL